MFNHNRGQRRQERVSKGVDRALEVAKVCLDPRIFTMLLNF